MSGHFPYPISNRVMVWITVALLLTSGDSVKTIAAERKNAIAPHKPTSSSRVGNLVDKQLYPMPFAVVVVKFPEKTIAGQRLRVGCISRLSNKSSRDMPREEFEKSSEFIKIAELLEKKLVGQGVTKRRAIQGGYKMEATLQLDGQETMQPQGGQRVHAVNTIQDTEFSWVFPIQEPGMHKLSVIISSTVINGTGESISITLERDVNIKAVFWKRVEYFFKKNWQIITPISVTILGLLFNFIFGILRNLRIRRRFR